MQRYEERSGRRLEDDIKASVATEMTPEPLRQHLILNQSRLNGYAAIVSEIGAFLEHRFENEANARDHSAKDQPVPMDVGSLVKGKGKGGGGRGKGHKGSQGTNSQWQPDDDKRTYILSQKEMQVPPYQIPFRSLLVRDAKNLQAAGVEGAVAGDFDRVGDHLIGEISELL